MRVCIYEDRPHAMVGVKLLILSLRRHCPEVEIVLCSPSADHAFRRWLHQHATVTWFDGPLGTSGWDVKPTFLLSQLDDGCEEAIWIDADIILAGDFRPIIADCADDELAATEENRFTPYPGGTFRTALWGLDVGRSLPNTINSGFVRVTPAHRELLEAWEICLSCDAYREAQRRAGEVRPLHMWGDQDVLTALLGSRRFAEVPLRFLRLGDHAVTMTTAAGYTLGERLRHVGGRLPPIIHPVTPKPWSVDGSYDRLAAELSPYTWVAGEYLDQLDDTDLVPAFEVRTKLGRICQALAFGDPALRGLPQALVHIAGKRIKRLVGRGNPEWPTERAHVEPVMEPDGESMLGDLGYGAATVPVG